jgi:hypothetical protein
MKYIKMKINLLTKTRRPRKIQDMKMKLNNKKYL